MVANQPWLQGITYDEMPNEAQEKVDKREEIYSKQATASETIDGEEAAMFYVGKDTMAEDALDTLDYTDDMNAVWQGNLTAAAIERVADDVLEATDADSAIIWDRTEKSRVYQETVDSENPAVPGATPLGIVKEIGKHYEDKEAEERAEAYLDRLESVLGEADPDAKQAVVQAQQEASDPVQACENLMGATADPEVETERFNKARKEVGVNKDPVFSKTMSSGYFKKRRKHSVFK